MGMSNMQVQQPMQQGSGKGGGMASPPSSTPNQPKTVEDLYSMYSDRGPDAEGLAFWKGQFGDDIDQSEIGKFQTSVRQIWDQEGKPASYGTTGQPRMGQPNPYSNTVQPWDNASIQPQQGTGKGGKGGGYPTAPTNFQYNPNQTRNATNATTGMSIGN